MVNHNSRESKRTQSNASASSGLSVSVAVLFFSFSVPASVHQQSFLGGDASASGSRAAGKSSKQHRDQQCQPLRLATFEFDYKKQRRHDLAASCDQTTTVAVGDSNAVGSVVTDVKSWFDTSATVNEAHRKIIAPTTENTSHSEVDNPCVNRHVEDEPLSLSADCLQDIRDLTTSLQDLMNNIDVKIDKTSTSSIPEKYGSSRLRNGNNSPEPGHFGESPLTSRKKHSVNTRNGNSLTDIHSTSSRSQRPENQSKPNSRQTETPRTAKLVIDRILRPKKRILSRASGFARNGSTERHPSIDRLSQSTDGLSGSSDNNIETSDSFVNIQFAKQSRRGNESSSTQSIESSGSFENTRFSWDSGSKDKLAEPTTDENRIQLVYVKTPANSEKRKSIGVLRGQMKPPTDYNGSKTSRPSMIPVQNNGGQPRSSLKPTESSKIPQNDQIVKLRDKKNLATSNVQCKSNESRSKRFSCFSQYSSRMVEANEAVGKVGRASIGNGRKCSSTDELREEQQKLVTPRTKRFSLYYTPQPSRKNYEAESKSTKNSSKTPANLGGSSSARPTSWRTPDAAKRVGEDVGNDRRDSTRNRRSVAECSTAASRNKASRQAVHLRGNATSTNSNLAPGRMK